MIGTWKWHYSIRTYDLYFDPPYSHQTIQTETKYVLEIKENGKVKMYEEGDKKGSYLISEITYGHPATTIPFDNYSSISFYFIIEDESWSGLVSEDSLKIRDHFPYEYDQGNGYTNFFYRSN